jgi:hypothetical protein
MTKLPTPEEVDTALGPGCSPEEMARRVSAAKRRLGVVEAAEFTRLRKALGEAVRTVETLAKVRDVTAEEQVPFGFGTPKPYKACGWCSCSVEVCDSWDDCAGKIARAALSQLRPLLDGQAPETNGPRNHCRCGNHISECVCEGPCPGCPRCAVPTLIPEDEEMLGMLMGRFYSVMPTLGPNVRQALAYAAIWAINKKLGGSK